MRRMAGLGAAFLAGGHFGRGRRLRFEGSLRGRRLEAAFEIADEGFEDKDAGFEDEDAGFEGGAFGLPNAAAGALGDRTRGRGVHAASMRESKGKRKIRWNGVNGYGNCGWQKRSFN